MTNTAQSRPDRPQPGYRKGQPRISVAGLKGRDNFDYLPDPRLIAALNAAIVLERPLLLTGEPGCGKTDFAWAVAGALNALLPGEDCPLLECHVRSDSRASDLLYRYDALHRFGDAHSQDPEAVQRSKDPRWYVKLAALGEALTAPRQVVVLIDEIDKAPRDLPNDLLREIDRGVFEIPELQVSGTETDKPKPGVDPDNLSPKTRWGHDYQFEMGPDNRIKPIVIITSNVERQLPDPFLRRCIFFNITFPKPERLTAIVRAHADGVPYIEHAVKLFFALRGETQLTKRPATSELLDWVNALQKMYRQEDVETLLRALAGAVKGNLRDGFELDSEKARWRELPGIHCLLKTREDLARVGCD